MWFSFILGLVGGLGLFLFGMNLMSSSLQRIAGGKIRNIVSTLTKNRLFSVIVGLIVTMIIQSSSATSVMVVGLVNAGIMQLSQAIGMILGANIGTTITGQLVSIDLVKLAPLALAFGMIYYQVTPSLNKKGVAQVFMGLGILFLGMGILKDSLAPLKEYPQFEHALINWGSHPIKGILIGFLLTFVMQSSSATIGVLIALAAEGFLPITSAIYILYGDNIGTCTTALLSSIGSSRNAKRVATMHLSINIIGTVIFALILHKYLINAVIFLDANSVARQVANAHTIFNIINVLILFPAAPLIVKLSGYLISKDKKNTRETHLDPLLIPTPSLAIENTLIEYSYMVEKVGESFDLLLDCISRDSDRYLENAFIIEKEINREERIILEYLQQLSTYDLNYDDRLMVDALFNSVNDIERVGDHLENIAELVRESIDQRVEYSSETRSELLDTFHIVREGFRNSVHAFQTGSIDSAKKSINIERQMDYLEKKQRLAHISRMNKREASVSSGIIYLDIMSNLERISDHSRNIAQTSLDLQGATSIHHHLYFKKKDNLQEEAS